MTAVILRAAVLDDAVDVARIKIAGWRGAYAGIVPDAVLEAMDDIRTAAFWSDLIVRPRPGTGLLVAERPARDREPARILGFVHIAPMRPDNPRDPPPPGRGEITALYVDPAAQRQGIGRRLLAAAFARLAEFDMPEARVWSLAENAGGNAFYERCGGARSETGEITTGGKALALIAYDWPAPATVRDRP
jgi:ribosomal protein S18 acetylase RimI-like enzyme